MTAPQCVTGCGRPAPDALACRVCARQLGERLTAAAGHAEDAWTVIARQTRYGGAGGARKAEEEPTREVEDERRNPVTVFGWAASIEKPRAGALVAEPLPVDLTAAERLADAGNTLTTWARLVCEERGVELPARRPALGPLCGESDCPHGSCAGVRRRTPPSDLGEAAAWLATQVEWLGKHRDAAEAFDELEDACRILRALVDRPGERVLVGMCDCGKVLYAPDGRQVVQCPEKLCQLRWDVDRSRDILREALREQLFTAAEAAHLAAYWDERTSEQIRKLISMWVQRGRLAAHGWIAGNTDADEARWPTYRFGDVIDRLATTERRRSRAESEHAA